MTYTVSTIGETSYDLQPRFTGLLDLELPAAINVLEREGWDRTVTIDVDSDNLPFAELSIVNGGFEFQPRSLDGKTVLYRPIGGDEWFDSGERSVPAASDRVLSSDVNLPHWPKKRKRG